MKKTIFSIGAGVLFIAAVSTVIDVVLHATGVFPPWGDPIGSDLASLALAYRIAVGIAGAWLTASLAPREPVKHAMYLGAFGVFLGIVGAVTTWNLDLSPRWYAVALVLVAIPQSLVGGLLVEASRARLTRTLHSRT